MIDTGSGEPGVSRAKTQSTEREEMFPLQANVDGILRFNCTVPEQKCILSQPNVGVDDNDETASSNAQVSARKEFTGLPIGRQRRGTASTEQSKQFDFGGLLGNFYFPSKKDSTALFFVPMSRISLLYCSVLSKKQVREARIIFTRGCESDWDTNQMRELLYQDRSAHRHLDLR